MRKLRNTISLRIGSMLNHILECYSHILCGGSAENFQILVILYWFGNKVIKKQSCKNWFILAELPMVWFIIGSNNRANRAFAICLMHKQLMLNRNRLKFWIQASVMWTFIIHVYWCNIERWCLNQRISL